jgi:hypothetical protein
MTLLLFDSSEVVEKREENFYEAGELSRPWLVTQR